MSTNEYDIHYLTYIQQTMEAILAIIDKGQKTLHEIHEELPYLDADTIREALKHLIIDFEVAELYVSTKERCPGLYEQIIHQDTFKNIRNQSPLRNRYKDLLEA